VTEKLNTVRSQKNGVVSKVNKKFISHLTRAQHTPSAATTVQVSHVLPAVRFSCLLRGRGDTGPVSKMTSHQEKAFVDFSRIFLLGILIFKGFAARRICKSFGVKGLTKLFFPLSLKPPHVHIGLMPPPPRRVGAALLLTSEFGAPIGRGYIAPMM
jgi:hypothetical protein